MEIDATFTAHTDAKFVASPDVQYDASLSVIDGLKRIVLRGVCLDTSVNRNNWQIPVDELESIAKKSVNIQLRLDHAQNVASVKGKILKTEIDEPHDYAKEEWDLENPYHHIHYEAEIITNDANIIIPILQGYVDHVSIGVDSKTVFCSSCGKSTRPGRECNCENAWEIVKNARVNEYSIVCSPAYDGAFFKPFSASEKIKKKSECDCEQDEKVEKTDRVQEISSVEEDNEVASVETDDTQLIAEEEEIEEEQLEASENLDQNIENETQEDDDNMPEEDAKFEELKAMVEKLASSTADLIASNNDLITRIAAIEAEEEEEEDDKKKTKKAGKDGSDEEASEDGSDEEASEDGEEKVACGCGGKKASKKKASNGMKEVPGARGDPPGEEKKPTVKSSPIEAGIVTTPLKSEVVSDNSMDKAINEIFKFAANHNVFPIE